MKEIARVVDFFVCPATFREMSENNMFPSARMNCVQENAIRRPTRVASLGAIA
jgi:hypothetical protein